MPQHPNIPVTCEQCGDTFFIHPCRVGKARFCSKACYWEYGRGPLADRFWAKVNKDGPIPAHCPDLGPCWLWDAALDGKGYGMIVVDGRIQRSHRVAYALAKGPIPDGLDVLHSCDNPACVNADHLRAGTKVENARDMVERKRYAAITHPERIPRGERNGAKTHPEGIRRGEDNGRAILRANDVREIRRLHALGGNTLKSLAAQYGVGFSTVSHIVKRQTWKSVN